MGESMSRYSIVERLTQSKLKIIDEMNKLDSDVHSKRLQATRKKAEIEETKKKIEEEYAERIEWLKRDAELLENEADTLEKFKEERKKALEEKKVEIDKAFLALQSISESANKQEETK